jgi:hypothetical protein
MTIMGDNLPEIAAFALELNKLMHEAAQSALEPDQDEIASLAEELTIINNLIEKKDVRGISTIIGDYIEMISGSFSDDELRNINLRLETAVKKRI